MSMARGRVTWLGETEAVHPILGLLRPGEAVEVEAEPSFLADLAADGSGLLRVEIDVVRVTEAIPAEPEEEG